MPLEVKKNLRSIYTQYEKKKIEPIGKDIIRMDRNESLFGQSDKVRPAIHTELSNLASYPENSAFLLRTSISNKIKVDADQIIIGNGSYELLSLIASVYLEEGEECIVPVPSFNWYEKFTLIGNGKVIQVPLKDFKTDLEGMLKRITEKTKIIWIVNPNNPTGTVLTIEELHTFMNKVSPEILVVVDEAYIEFSTKYDLNSSIDLVNQYENVILLRTFSKFYGLASLRIGYGIANLEVINNLLQYRIPPNHNRLGVSAARAAFDDGEFFLKTKKNIINQKEYVYLQLQELDLEFIESETNFVFINFKRDTNDIINELKNRKFLVKSGSEYGFGNWIRITLGTAEINQRFFKNLKEVLGHV